MNDFNDGGPVYPVAEDHQTAGELPWAAGISLRDWFAGQALSAAQQQAFENGLSLGSNEGMRAIADVCYGIADAMLAERGQGGK